MENDETGCVGTHTHAAEVRWWGWSRRDNASGGGGESRNGTKRRPLLFLQQDSPSSFLTSAFCSLLFYITNCNSHLTFLTRHRAQPHISVSEGDVSASIIRMWRNNINPIKPFVSCFLRGLLGQNRVKLPKLLWAKFGLVYKMNTAVSRKLPKMPNV